MQPDVPGRAGCAELRLSRAPVENARDVTAPGEDDGVAGSGEGDVDLTLDGSGRVDGDRSRVDVGGGGERRSPGVELAGGLTPVRERHVRVRRDGEPARAASTRMRAGGPRGAGAGNDLLPGRRLAAVDGAEVVVAKPPALYSVVADAQGVCATRGERGGLGTDGNQD